MIRKDLRVFWQGPTLGWDFGGEGARTMMLVYGLPSTDAMYQRFVRVDGSAYVVGGLGMTVLTFNNVVVVPIRSGVGLRLGANIGYLKFTDRPTWNPFLSLRFRIQDSQQPIWNRQSRRAIVRGGRVVGVEAPLP